MPSCVHTEGRGYVGAQQAEADALSLLYPLFAHRLARRNSGDEDMSLPRPTSCIKGGGQGWGTGRETPKRGPPGKREGHAGGVVRSPVGGDR